MTSALLELEGIVKRYPGTLAVRFDEGERLSFEPGQIHALAGQNGAGKSTLVNIMAGIDRPSAGRMRLRGAPYAPSSADDARRRRVDIVLQELQVIDNLSVEENLVLGRERSVTSLGLLMPGARRRASAAAMEAVVRDIPLRARAGDLSLEEKKIIEFARAMSADPEVLIVDELSTCLSERGAAEIRDSLRKFVLQGKLVVYISHHIDELMEICDRVTILRDGRLVKTMDVAATNKDEISTLMVGHSIAAPSVASRAVREQPPVLSVEGLRSPGRFSAVSFDVHAGEVVGIAGMMDSGADALGLSLFGAQPASGTVRLNGQRVNWKRPASAVAAGVGYVPADRDRDGLLLSLRVESNVALPSLKELAQKGIVRPSRTNALACRLIKRLQIRCRGPRDVPQTMSGGNRQKVVMAKWLARDENVLILHGPTRGVDVEARAEIHKVIRSLTDEGVAVLLISDDLQELLDVCDTWIVMRCGSVSAFLTRLDNPSEEDLIRYMI